jgi:hypothetical protein
MAEEAMVRSMRSIAPFYGLVGKAAIGPPQLFVRPEEILTVTLHHWHICKASAPGRATGGRVSCIPGMAGCQKHKASRLRLLRFAGLVVG